ncbi:MAG: hypothetical protein Q4P34_03580 [Tissierellia bacterium]|nr:hypothetical protein [Tissierellia bacterium]
MKNYKKIFAAILLTSIIVFNGFTAYAYPRFYFILRAGETKSSASEKKVDNLTGLVDLRSNNFISGEAANFRIRTATGAYATEYRTLYGNARVDLAYLSGMGVYGNYYRLYSNPEVIRISPLRVSGEWMP